MLAMDKMKNGLFIILMISGLMIGPGYSYALNEIDNNEKIELVNAWKIFLKAVSTNDVREIKTLSVKKIRCLSCLENTEKEIKEMTAYQETEPNWYGKIYKEKVYIPVNKFCKEDYPIIFSKKFVEKLQNSKPTYAAEDLDGKKIYEVMIATSKPGELSPGHEGVLHLFQFIRTKNGYKFWGIDTVP